MSAPTEKSLGKKKRVLLRASENVRSVLEMFLAGEEVDIIHDKTAVDVDIIVIDVCKLDLNNIPNGKVIVFFYGGVTRVLPSHCESVGDKNSLITAVRSASIKSQIAAWSHSVPFL